MAIAARAEGKAHVTLERNRQHKALIVVGVFADQIHAARPAAEVRRLGAKMLFVRSNQVVGALVGQYR